MADINDIFSNPATIDRVVQSIERASRELSDITDEVQTIADVAIAAADKFGVNVEKIKRSVSDGLSDTKKRFEETAGFWEKLNKKFQANLQEQNREVKNFFDYWETRLKSVGGSAGVMTDSLGLTGSRGLLGSAQRVLGQITSSFPMGGVIGALLYGTVTKEGFRADTATLMREFAGVGGATAAQFKAARGDVETFFKEWGSHGEEIQATFSALRGFGLLSGEVFEKAGSAAAKARIESQRLLTGIDLLSNLAPGTSAKVAGTAIAATGASLKDVTRDFMSLYHAAQLNNIEFGNLMETMSQGSSTLRMQRAGTLDLADAYFRLQKGLEHGAGMKEKQAGIAAMSGVQAVAQGISGMSMGMWGALAQQMKMPGDTLDNVMKLRLGMAGEGKGDVTNVVKGLQDLSRNMGGGNEFKRIFALEKLGFGLEGAQAIVRMERDGIDVKKAKDIFKTPQDALLAAIEARGTQANAWESIMRKAMVDIANIGASLLGALLVELKGIGMFLKFKSQGRGGDAERVIQKATDAAGRFITSAGDSLTALTKDTKGELKQLFRIEDLDIAATPAEARKDKAKSRSRHADLPLTGVEDVGAAVVHKFSGDDIPAGVKAKHGGEIIAVTKKTETTHWEKVPHGFGAHVPKTFARDAGKQ